MSTDNNAYNSNAYNSDSFSRFLQSLPSFKPTHSTHLMTNRERWEAHRGAPFDKDHGIAWASFRHWQENRAQRTASRLLSDISAASKKR